MRFSARLIRCIQLSFFILLLPSSIAAPSYIQITGAFDTFAYDASGKTNDVLQRRFEVLIDDHLWILRVFHPDDLCVESVGVGQAIFTYPLGYKRTALTVVGGNYPYHESTLHSVPWLAFCSARYFAKNDVRWTAIPGDFPTDSPFAHIARAEATFLSNSTLPSTIRFYADAERLKTAKSSPHLDADLSNIASYRAEERKTDYAAEYKPGTLLADYRVLSRTNAAPGRPEFPAQFEYKLYGKLSPGTNQPVLLGCRVDGVVNSIALINGTLQIPNPTGIVHVVDRRLANRALAIDYFNYSYTNRDLPLQPPASARKAFAELEKSRALTFFKGHLASIQKPAVDAFQGAITATIVALACAAILFLSRKSSRHPRK